MSTMTMRCIRRRRRTAGHDHAGIFGLSSFLIILLPLLLQHRSLSVTANERQGAIATENNSTTTNEIELSVTVRDNVDWFVALLNDRDDETFNETDYRERFTDDFVARVPPEQFVAVVDGIRAMVAGGDHGEDVVWTVIEIVLSVPNGAIVRITAVGGGGGDEEAEILLNLSVNDVGRVDGLLVSPAEPPTLDDPPATVVEAADRLSRLARNFSYLVAEVVVAGADGSPSPSCTVLAGSGEDEPSPLGSMFKLYVLGAVVDAVLDGAIDWDENVTIVDDYRSVPSGITQDDPPDTNRTVRELAELMISISDNTATDHLMALVGREAVEAALVDYGHHDPGLNVPFLSTREMALLKLEGKEFGHDDDDVTTTPGPVGRAYVEAEGDVEERRNILSDLGNRSVDGLNYNLAAWVAGEGRPIAVEGIEWFGSPLDLCRVLSILHLDVEARRILSINPGLPDYDGLWSHVAFKGGSEPGVLGMAWYLEAVVAEGDGDGDDVVRRVVTGTLWDPDRPVENGTDAALLLGALRDVSLGDLSHGEETDQTTAGASSHARYWRRPTAWLIPVPLCVLSLAGT